MDSYMMNPQGASQPADDQQGMAHPAEQLNPQEQQDLKIADLLGEHLLHGGGFAAIQKAYHSSSDPGQMIGHFLLQMGQQMMENMPQNMKLSPKILLVKDGWLEHMSDMIQDKIGVPKEVMNKAEIFVASTATQMAKAKQAQGQGTVNGIPAPPVATPSAPAPQGGGAPVMPQQAGPVMPMQGGQ